MAALAYDRNASPRESPSDPKALPRTPTLDRFAREGVRFARACSNPVCNPMRNLRRRDDHVSSGTRFAHHNVLDRW